MRSLKPGIGNALDSLIITGLPLAHAIPAFFARTSFLTLSTAILLEHVGVCTC